MDDIYKIIAYDKDGNGPNITEVEMPDGISAEDDLYIN